MNPIDSKNLERIADALTLKVLQEFLFYSEVSGDSKQREARQKLQRKIIKRELKEDE